MRKIFTFLLGALLVMFLGCHSVETSSTVVRIDLKSNGHKQLLTDYSSPYTLAYRNKDDTYTLYIFSAPVQYQKNGQYFLIDTSIVKSKRADYSFENKEGDIKTYFPESLDRPFLIESETNQFSFQVEKNASSYQKGKQILHTNMYGDPVEAVLYEGSSCDLAFYSTRAGIQMEVIFKENPIDINFMVITDYALLDTQNGYYVLADQGERVGMLCQPMTSYQKGKEVSFCTPSKIQANRQEGWVLAVYSAETDEAESSRDGYPIRLSAAFELYRNKLPDSSVYSNSEANMFLSPYAVIGMDPIYGEGWHYVRSRFRYFSESIKPSSIQSCTYNTYLLSKNSLETGKITAYKLEEQWSSTSMLWNTRNQVYGDCLSEGLEDDKLLVFDMTQLAKDSMKDLELFTESTGFLLKKDSMEPADIIATSDNAEYIPYFRLDLNALPQDFSIHENINPQNGVL